LDQHICSRKLRSIPLFKLLPKFKRQQIAAETETVAVKRGEVVVKEGDPSDAFYIVREGTLKVTQRKGKRGVRGGTTSNSDDEEEEEEEEVVAEEVEIAKLRSGDFFGEVGLIQRLNRTASVTVVSATAVLLRIRRGAFTSHIAGDESGAALRKELLRCAQLRQAEAAVLNPTSGRHSNFHNVFGETVVLHSPRGAAVGGKEDGKSGGGSGAGGDVSCAEDDDDEPAATELNAINPHFDERLAKEGLEGGNLEKICRLGSGTFANVYLVRHGEEGLVRAMKVVQKSTAVDGCQVRHTHTTTGSALSRWALSSCTRSLLFPYIRSASLSHSSILHKQVRNLQLERRVLDGVVCPFIVKLFATFQDENCVYFILEYCPGGELWALLYDHDEDIAVGEDPASQIRGEFGGLSSSASAFYTACVILALEHLHQRRIAYRDIKAENCLIAANGYLKLCDFGFACMIPYRQLHGDARDQDDEKNGGWVERTFTLCGTPEYLAPEVVLGKGHNRSADFWALGVLVYEMICAATPFEDEEGGPGDDLDSDNARDSSQVFERIAHSEKHLRFPKGFDRHAKEMVRGLLTPSPVKRMGMQKRGMQDVKQVKWFPRGSWWVDMASHDLNAPFIPVLEDDADVDLFGEQDEEGEGEHDEIVPYTASLQQQAVQQLVEGGGSGFGGDAGDPFAGF
jgi:serine/threonine protein kinase/CRP-like cAMP-binding protein